MTLSCSCTCSAVNFSLVNSDCWVLNDEIALNKSLNVEGLVLTDAFCVPTRLDSWPVPENPDNRWSHNPEGCWSDDPNVCFPNNPDGCFPNGPVLGVEGWLSTSM